MKHFALILLSAVLFSTSCKKDTTVDNNNTNNIDLNGKTNFFVGEENEYRYTFSETPTTAVIIDDNGKRQLRIAFEDVYPDNKPFKAEIVVNDFAGPGKYILNKEGTVAIMTDDNRDGDAYWANYYNQSGYGSYTKSYSPLTYLTVLKASDGKLIVDIDMILWHNLVASGYSTVLSAKWQGRAYADLN